MKEKISVCITTGNEERNIRRCLESVKWADEIVVADSFSVDNTVNICREYTDLVYRHRWLGYIGQKNLIKDLAAGPWILFIDADEEISDELREEILAEFKTGSASGYSGYSFPRMVRFLDRWITHGDWYPDLKLRLFRKDKGECGGREPHDKIIVQGAIKQLKGHMYHYTYENIDDQIATLNKFSTITAMGWKNDRKKFRMIDFLFRPGFKFFRSYFLKRGFMDGFPGFVIATAASFGVFIKYAKLWEANNTQDSTAKKPPEDSD